MVTSRFGERQPPRRLLGDDGGPSVHGDGFLATAAAAASTARASWRRRRPQRPRRLLLGDGGGPSVHGGGGPSVHGDGGAPNVHGDGFFDGGGPSIDGTTTTKKASKGSYRRQEGGRNPRMHEYNKNGEKFRSARGPGGATSRTRPEAKKAVPKIGDEESPRRMSEMEFSDLLTGPLDLVVSTDDLTKFMLGMDMLLKHFIIYLEYPRESTRQAGIAEIGCCDFYKACFYMEKFYEPMVVYH
uniref:Uncharacterized protein n=1 Tax=Oryza rufipogon TaxID=4529 RepID=A0A0E0N0J4_ORYRU